MLRIILTGLAIGLVATIATADRAVSQDGKTVCRPGGSCVVTTVANYNGCVDLALRRGLLQVRSDRHNLDLFIYDCVAGRVGGR